MKDCHFCWVFEPARSIRVASDIQAAVEFPVNLDGTNYALSLFWGEDDSPHFARLLIAGLPTEELPGRLLPEIRHVKEHLLTCLKLYLGPTISQLPFVVYCFSESGQPYDITIGLETGRRGKFKPEALRALFLSSFGHREELRLLMNGLDFRLPAAYRFLSLYKVLEIHYKSGGRWRLADLQSAFATSIPTDGIDARSVISYIHRIRDKCAHARIGKRIEAAGITELSYDDEVEVKHAIRLVGQVCTLAINASAVGSFEIDTEFESMTF